MDASTPMKPLSVDLFCGAGGFGLGAHRAGFDVVLAVDRDETLSGSYSSNFPRTPVRHLDLLDSDAACLLHHAGVERGDLALVTGGPPCQGFSNMGHRDPDDVRNSLVPKFFELVEGMRPAAFVMENVPGLLRPPFDALLKTGLAHVKPHYEIVGPVVLNAAHYGAATIRKRAFVLGYDTTKVFPFDKLDILNLATPEPVTVKEAIHDLPGPAKSPAKDGRFLKAIRRRPAEGPIGDYARNLRSAPGLGLAAASVRQVFDRGRAEGFNPTKHTTAVVERFSKVERGKTDTVSRCKRLAWNEPCVTLRAGTGSDRGSFQAVRPIHPDEPRAITIREAARLQGFPDWFRFHPTIWHSFRMIGNSVPPPLAERLLSFVASRLDAQNQGDSSE